MKIVGTPQEISGLMEKCKELDCDECILYDYCCHDIFIKRQEEILLVPIKPILIQKGVKHEDCRDT